MVDNIAPVMDDVAARAVAALAAVNRRPGRVVPIAPGVAPAWDGDCAGYLYGRIVLIAPIVDAQASRSPNMKCNVHFWNVTLAIAIVRCVAVVANSGKPPHPGAIDIDGRGFSLDASVLRDVLKCAPSTRSIVQGVPLEEQGGYSGFEWTYTTRVDACPCPAE